MEPTIIGSWSKRSSRAVATSSADEGPGGLRPQKRLKQRASVSEHDSSGPEEDEHDKKFTSNLLLIRDVIEELQSKERDFHRSQQARYECLKRDIIDMESRWTKEKYKRSMAKAKKKERHLVEMLSRQQREDPVASTKSLDQDMVRREALTPVASREAVSSLPTPSETVSRLTFWNASGTRADGAEQKPAAGDTDQEGGNLPRFSAEQKGKQKIRLLSPTPRLRKKGASTELSSPPEPAYREPSIKRTRKSKTPVPVIINSSDGDDEDDNAEDLQSLRDEFAQRAGISTDDVALDWPVGVGIGTESIEVDMPDHMSVSDVPLSNPDPILSPLTVCAVENVVPVCPGPFKMTPRLVSPALSQVRSLRKRMDINYKERLRLGLSDDDMDLLTPSKARRGPKLELHVSDDESYRPETVPESSNVAISTTKIDKSSDETRGVINVKKDHIALGQKAPGYTAPAKDARRKSSGENNQQLIRQGRLLPLSDDDDEDELAERMDVDKAPPPVRAPQPPVCQSGGLSTGESIRVLGAPPPVLNVPNPMTRFSRIHIQKALGGKPRGTVTVVRQNSDKVFPVDQFLCINGKLNPYYPSRPGVHGAMFIFRTGIVPLNTEWAVFCSRPKVGTIPQESFEYVGHYVVKDVSDLSYDEWMASSAKFKEGWVNHISREAKAAKGWARLNLASRGLIRVTDQVLPEQVRGWFNATTETNPKLLHARLGRRILEFREYKRGLYDSLVKVKQQMDEKKLERS